MREAGLPVRCLSLQSPIGSDGRSSWLIHLRDLREEVSGHRHVNPLSREQSIAVPTTGYDDVRAVALARLALPSVKNIQVDWAQYGPKLAQVALTFGANDLDRVSTVDDESLGKRRTSVEDVRRNIAAAGFKPVERAPSHDAIDSQRDRGPPLAQDRPLRLGAVSYLNTKPLVYGLDAYPDQFDVRFDVPAKCAELLHAGPSRPGTDPRNRIPARRLFDRAGHLDCVGWRGGDGRDLHAEADRRT